MKYLTEDGRFRCSKDIVSAKEVYWHLYDQNGNSVLTYFDFLATKMLFANATYSAIESDAYTLRMWFEYLYRAGVDQYRARDDNIREFRDQLSKRRSNNLSGNQLARNRTINTNLRTVYNFYAWLQMHAIYGKRRYLLGKSGYNITSTLADTDTDRTSDSDRYPLLFTRTGANSKHKITHVPTDLEVEHMTDYLHATQSEAVAVRNILMQDIPEQTGLRRASFNSLTVDQFTPELLQECEKAGRLYLVCPADQKYGYDNHFKFNFVLVMRIIHYIANERNEIVVRTGSTSKALFLNQNKGTPLTTRYISIIFSRVSRALKLPRGSGVHSLRRRFANKNLGTIYQASRETGGDTSMETLLAINASSMGHSSTQSQEAYLRNVLNNFGGTNAVQQSDEITRLKNENALLRAELGRAKRGKC